MKKAGLLILLLVAVATASAQPWWGAKIGGNLTRPSSYQVTLPDGSSGSHVATRYGGHVGGYVGYAFSERWGMQGELQILLSNTLYLDIPLLATFKPFSTQPITFMAGALLSMTGSVTHTDGFYPEPYDSNKAGASVDLFPALSVGMQYDFGKHLNLGLRYNHGFINDIDFEHSTTDGGYHSEKGGKHRTIQLSVGWTF